jgi:3-phenylpropionate/trans-cinnamate dioxygenase ferredoxin subunit
MAEWIKVATVDELPPGERIVVDADYEFIAIFNAGGTLYAINDTCSHAEASLSEGDLDGHEITCPLHGARFDIRTGDVLSFPAVAGVDTYEVKTEGDDIYLRLP